MLPSYSKQYPQDAEQAEPFLASTDVDVRTSSETAPPLYPPTSTPGTDGRYNVEYSYAPVYPRKGKIENVVGVLGNTKRETIQIVRRGIQGLSDIDPDRMIFKMLIGQGEGSHWAKILDEAWERFDRDPPKRIAVVVSDLPGDEALRKRLDMWKIFAAVMGLLAIILFSIGMGQLAS